MTRNKFMVYIDQAAGRALLFQIISHAFTTYRFYHSPIFTHFPITAQRFYIHKSISNLGRGFWAEPINWQRTKVGDTLGERAGGGVVGGRPVSVTSGGPPDTARVSDLVHSLSGPPPTLLPRWARSHPARLIDGDPAI